jgi:hypothetical protein
MSKGRKASRKPNMVFTGVFRKDGEDTVANVKFNDENGGRHVQIIKFGVENNSVVITERIEAEHIVKQEENVLNNPEEDAVVLEGGAVVMN